MTRHNAARHLRALAEIASKNGRVHKHDAEPDTPLLWVLRQQFGLTGTQYGCGVAQCDAGTVRTAGVANRSRVRPVWSVARTDKRAAINGLSPKGQQPVHEAWVELDLPQRWFLPAPKGALAALGAARRAAAVRLRKVCAGGRRRRPGRLAGTLVLALSAPVWAQAGDAARGAAIVASRSQGLCGLCHALPDQPEHLQGTLGPPLHGVGARYSTADLRAHLLAPERFNSDTLMPAYGRRDGLVQVAPALRGKPLLDAQQIDDVVAYLASLR